MPPPRKPPRACTAPPSPDQNENTPPPQPPPPPEEEDGDPPALTTTLPADLLPEVAARSDVTTLVRFAACCKPLRRDILRPAFIRRVCREPGPGGGAAVVPPFVLGFLHAYDRASMEEEYQDQPPAPYFSAAHPATPGVASFFEEHLAPFAARTAGASLLGDYEPLTSSRNGLVVLRRRYLGGGDRSSEICVYDPMSGDRTFLSSPPDFQIWDRAASDYGVSYTYVLLTASDGIAGCSSLVLAAGFTCLEDTDNLMVQTVSLDNADDATFAWAPVTMATSVPRSRWSSLQPHCQAVVLRGYIHWLMYDAGEICWPDQDPYHILTYDVRTATAGSIQLPNELDAFLGDTEQALLGSFPDGRLSYLVANELKISVWLRQPAGDGWSRHAVIDIARAPRSLTPPSMPSYWWVNDYWWVKEVVEFSISGVMRSGAILVQPFKGCATDNMEEETDSMEEAGEQVLAVLDMETKELRRVNQKNNITVFPYEIDLEARLSAMKTF